MSFLNLQFLTVLKISCKLFYILTAQKKSQGGLSLFQLEHRVIRSITLQEDTAYE